jgi:Flp pilus assembly protein TadG
MARRTRRGQHGQVLVLVALGLVAMIAMVGLILDGGSSFGQRRTQQRGADLSALAGANDLLLNNDPTSAEAMAFNVAMQNGYDPALVAVTVTQFHPVGGKVKVDITAPHQNSFTSIVGMNSWDVSVTATAVAGIQSGASGAGPIMFSVDDFSDNGEPKPEYTEAGCPAAPVTPPENGCSFATVNGDAPAGGNDIAWSNYGLGNVNTNEVKDIISGELVIEKTVAPNEYIGQYNNGWHADVFHAVNNYLVGQDILVPIVTEQVPGIPDGPLSCGAGGGAPAGGGCFQGWAVFHVVAAVGGSDKHIYGYFKSNMFAPGAVVEDCPPPTSCPRSFGTNYGLYLAE